MALPRPPAPISSCKKTGAPICSQRKKKRSVALLLLYLFLLILSSCARQQQTVLLDLVSANQLYEQADYAQALVQYEGLVKKTPRDGELWFRLANCYMRTGQPEAAIQGYRNALLREPDMGKAWYNLGQIHLNMALKAYGDATKYLRPDDPAKDLIDQRYQELFELLNRGSNETEQNTP